jgi:hypothetical protein
MTDSTKAEALVLIAGLLWGIAIGLSLFPVLYVLLTGDFPGAQVFYGLQEDHWLVALLLAIR